MRNKIIKIKVKIQFCCFISPPDVRFVLFTTVACVCARLFSRNDNAFNFVQMLITHTHTSRQEWQFLETIILA